MHKVTVRCRGLVVALSAFAAFAPPAQAGTYDVLACDAAPNGSVQSWTFDTNDPGIAAPVNCPTHGSALSGMALYNVVDNALVSYTGQYARWLFHAPAGTSIDGVSTDYSVERKGQNWWWGRWGADSTPLQGCNYGDVPYSCSWGTTPGTTTWIAAGGSSNVGYSVGCIYSTWCSHNGVSSTTGSQIAMFVRSAAVRVIDPSAPALSVTGGGLSGAGGVVSGDQSVTYDASDNVGIKAVSFAVDGVDRGSLASTCDYTRKVPCPNVAGSSQSFDTTRLADGPHTLIVTALDTANNARTSTPYNFSVDNTAPAKAAAVSVTQGEGWRAAAVYDVSWTNPVDGGTAIAKAHWQLCDVSACVAPQVQTGNGIASLHDVRVPHDGDWALRIWLEDAKGNVEPANASDPVHLRYDASAPARPENLILGGGQAWRTSNSFDLTWEAPAGQLAPVHTAYAKLCDVDGRCTVESRQATDSLTGVQVPGPGDYTLRVWLGDEAGNASETNASDPIHLRFDDTDPGLSVPSGSDRWLSASSFDGVVRLAGAAPPSGIAGYSVTSDGSEPDATSDTGSAGAYHLTGLPEGEVTIRSRALSAAGVASHEIGSTVLHVDRTPPSVTVAGAPDPDAWQPAGVSLTFIASDQAELSGMTGGHVTYCVDGGAPRDTSGGQAVVAVSGDGEHVVAFRAADLAGNSSATQTVAFRIDSTPPPAAGLNPAPDWLTSDGYTQRVELAGATPLSGLKGWSFTSDGSEPDAVADTEAAQLELNRLPEGTTVVKVRAVSGSGLASTRSSSVELNVDRTAPEPAVEGAPDPEQWQAGAVRLRVRAQDGLSGVQRIAYRVDSGSEIVESAESATVTVAESGHHEVSYYASDVAGNRSQPAVVRFKIDTEEPGRAEPQLPDGWIHAAGRFAFTVNAPAPLSGISGYAITTDGSYPGYVATAGPDGATWIESVAEGETVVKARAISVAGIPSTKVGTGLLRVDRSAPSVKATGADGGWQASAVEVVLAAVDQPGLSGVHHIAYRDDGASGHAAGDHAVVPVETDGRHVVRFSAVDAAGNESPEDSVEVLVDQTPPDSVFFEPPGEAPAEVVVAASDATSGLAGGTVELRRAGDADWIAVPTSVREDGLHAELDPSKLAGFGYELRATVVDGAGNRTTTATLADGIPMRVSYPAPPAPEPAPAPQPQPQPQPPSAQPSPPAKAAPVPTPKAPAKTTKPKKAKPRRTRCTSKSRSRACVKARKKLKPKPKARPRGRKRR